MDEDVLRAVVGGDEPVALLIAEPLDGSSWHAIPPLLCAAKRGGMHEATPCVAPTQKFAGLSPGRTGATVAGSSGGAGVSAVVQDVQRAGRLGRTARSTNRARAVLASSRRPSFWMRAAVATSRWL